MFRINHLPKNVLITPDEVIRMCSADNTPGITVIEQSIQVAEERFIKPTICRDLYDYFRNKKNVLITDVNKSFFEGADYFNAPVEVGDRANAIELVDDEWLVNLWNEHLWKLTAEAVVYSATVPNWSRFSASGEMINNPKTIDSGEGAASAELQDLKFKLTKMAQDIIDPLVAGVKEYLAYNRGRFPHFNCHEEFCRSCCGDDSNNNGISVARKTSWVHIYDRRRKSNCDHDHY